MVFKTSSGARNQKKVRRKSPLLDGTNSDVGSASLAGFMLARLGELPAPAQSVLHDGYRFIVIAVRDRRILSVEILLLSPDANA